MSTIIIFRNRGSLRLRLQPLDILPRKRIPSRDPNSPKFAQYSLFCITVSNNIHYDYMAKFEAPILIVNHKFKYNNYFTVQIVLCLAIGLFNPIESHAW